MIRDGLDPAHTGLLVFDMLLGYRDRIVQAGALEPAVRLVEACRHRSVPIFFARADHRPDGADLNRVLTDTDPLFRSWVAGEQQPDRPSLDAPEMAVLEELGPRVDDYDVPKHRWSALHGTHLELSLRSRGVNTILLIGGSTHVGIASTAFAARDMDFNVVVVSDACFGLELQKRFFLEHVFPRMCRVRTVDQTIKMLEMGFRADP
jgi:nicotinamidase-related amidase